MDPEINSGVTEQKAAAPAPTLENAFEIESDQAEAATGHEDEANETEPREAEQPGPQEETKAEEVPDAVWAKARRRAETEAQRKLDRLFAQRFGGYKNPTTGQSVQSVEDYFAALDAQQEATRETMLRQAAEKLPPETAQQLIQAVKNDPERQRLQEKVAELERQQLAREGEQLLGEQLRQIAKLDPAVKSLADLAAMPEFGEFDRLMRAGGHDLVSAYKLACFDRLAEKRAKASRQAAINAAKGKQHLAPVGGGAGGEEEISDEDFERYRAFIPKITRTEAARKHQEYMRGRSNRNV